MSDIDTAAADSLKALDLEWPIREADITRNRSNVESDPEPTRTFCACRIAQFPACGVLECRAFGGLYRRTG